MNDYWNDPPEGPEPPACPDDHCDGSGEYLYDGKTGQIYSCDKCGFQWVISFEPDQEPTPEEPVALDEDPEPKPCPHGNIGECDSCDRLSDFLYDANREGRK